MHDWRRVLADVTYSVADGARVISDFRVMGGQRELFGAASLLPVSWQPPRTGIPAAGDGELTDTTKHHGTYQVTVSPPAVLGARKDRANRLGFFSLA